MCFTTNKGQNLWQNAERTTDAAEFIQIMSDQAKQIYENKLQLEQIKIILDQLQAFGSLKNLFGVSYKLCQS